MRQTGTKQQMHSFLVCVVQISRTLVKLVSESPLLSVLLLLGS